MFPASPANSLLLTKGTGQVPHGGGKKLAADSPEFKTLLAWIEAGAPRTPADAPKIVRISVDPHTKQLKFRETVQLKVTAHWSDGSTTDATRLAQFSSSESVYAAVSPDGLVTAGPMPGEAAIMARFMERFAVAPVVIPLPGDVPAAVYEGLPRRNFIDGLVWAKLQKLGLTPSGPAGDAAFHRRAYLDIIGRLPTPDETRAFLADTDPQKRDKLIELLLQRPSTPTSGRTSGPTCCGRTRTTSA